MPTKQHLVAPIIPGLRRTYQFSNSQEQYYEQVCGHLYPACKLCISATVLSIETARGLLQYAESIFGVTMMKAGWDCMR